MPQRSRSPAPRFVYGAKAAGRPTVWRLLRKNRPSTPIAKSVPTGVSGGERKGIIGQCSGQSRSGGQDNHDLPQHRPTLFRRDCAASCNKRNHPTGSDFIGIAFERTGLSQSEPGPPFLVASENFGVLWHRSQKHSAERSQVASAAACSTGYWVPLRGTHSTAGASRRLHRAVSSLDPRCSRWRLFSSTSVKRFAFWIAGTDCAAKVCSNSTVCLGNSPGALRRTTSAPTIRSAPSSGTISRARKPARTMTSRTSR
jgi:hypothetical protein